MPDPPLVDEEVPDDSGRGVAALLGRLADDGRSLLRQEIELAKAEVQETALHLARSSAYLGAGVLFLCLGLVVLLVFAVLALGRLLGGEYWLSSLILGLLSTAVGGALVFKGRRGAGRDELKPTKTIASARQTADWARGEMDELKRDLRIRGKNGENEKRR